METDDLNSRLEVNVVNPLLTDFYQFSMIYAHWKNGRAKSPAVFDLYFRKCPFKLKVNFFLNSLVYLED
jgi:nicotinic acid phosphoribosyltransferase